MTPLLPVDESRLLGSARTDLTRAFPDMPEAEVARLLAALAPGAPVRSFLGVLAQREATGLLRRS